MHETHLISNGGQDITLTLDPEDGELFIKLEDGPRAMDAGIDGAELLAAIQELMSRQA